MEPNKLTCLYRRRPHPSPLPAGEGTSYLQSEKLHSYRIKYNNGKR